MMPLRILALKILEGDALFLGRLFQVFKGGKIILLADLVQPLDQLGFAVDVQFLALWRATVAGRSNCAADPCGHRQSPAWLAPCWRISSSIPSSPVIVRAVMIWSLTRAMISSTVLPP